MIAKTKPVQCFTSGCPLAKKGKGFCLGVGDPKKALVGINLEAPGKDEVGFEIDLFKRAGKDELARRKKAYPDIPPKILARGVPIVGRSGALMNSWVFRAAGMERSELFIDNTLRCLPPKRGDSNYPIGEERKQAEKCCRQYDRWDEMKPKIAVATLHPAGILRDMTALPLLIKDLQKVRDFAKAGYKTIALVGGKSVKQFLGYGESITRFRGHYTWLKKEKGTHV